MTELHALGEWSVAACWALLLAVICLSIRQKSLADAVMFGLLAVIGLHFWQAGHEVTELPQGRELRQDVLGKTCQDAAQRRRRQGLPG